MWVIRGGEQNRLVDAFVDAGVTGVGYGEVPDAEIMTRTEIRRLLVDGGTSAAVGFPRRVTTNRSPAATRSSSSENLRLASATFIDSIMTSYPVDVMMSFTGVSGRASAPERLEHERLEAGDELLRLREQHP